MKKSTDERASIIRIDAAGLPNLHFELLIYFMRLNPASVRGHHLPLIH